MNARQRLTVCIFIAGLALSSSASATRSLEEFRFFRALSVDLNGRIPSRAEVAAFARDDFNVERWVDDHLRGPNYAERMRRIYTDLLRLELSNAFIFQPPQTLMRRVAVLGPDGPAYVYYRAQQRRSNPETDGSFCFTTAESGVQVLTNRAPVPECNTPVAIPRDVWERNTVAVRPWWLYRDYRAASPSQVYGPGWATTVPGFVPGPALLAEAPGATPSAGMPTIRVCREEAGMPAQGAIALVERRRPSTATTCALRPGQPGDSAYARLHVGELVDCNSSLGFASSPNCGCGVGLERCLPATSNNQDSAALMAASRSPIGVDAPFDYSQTSSSQWLRYWWSQEAIHFIDDLFESNGDFRSMLNGHQTSINGPLAQFYRSIAPVACCGSAATAFQSTQAVPLFQPSAIPTALQVHDVTRWEPVADRGPLASGLLTMPIFLTKYGSRRSRVHVLWNAFTCQEFSAPAANLVTDDQPDLRMRAGCQDCHIRLEPMAAYFARIPESTWNFLPAANFPILNPRCSTVGAASLAECNTYYDPAFATTTTGMLRGAYGDQTNANEGPAGLARDLIADPHFAPCVTENIASSFLGRALTPDDETLKQQLTTLLRGNQFRVRDMVRALLMSEAYRNSNNVASNLWRTGGGR